MEEGDAERGRSWLAGEGAWLRGWLGGPMSRCLLCVQADGRRMWPPVGWVGGGRGREALGTRRPWERESRTWGEHFRRRSFQVERKTTRPKGRKVAGGPKDGKMRGGGAAVQKEAGLCSHRGSYAPEGSMH